MIFDKNMASLKPYLRALITISRSASISGYVIMDLYNPQKKLGVPKIKLNDRGDFGVYAAALSFLRYLCRQIFFCIICIG